MSALYEDDSCIVTIKPGSIITYLLAPKDEPTNPLKVWRGKVRLFDSTHIVVELTEQGYNYSSPLNLAKGNVFPSPGLPPFLGSCRHLIR